MIFMYLKLKSRIPSGFWSLNVASERQILSKQNCQTQSILPALLNTLILIYSLELTGKCL